MACVADSDNKDIKDSLTKTSEELKEMYCEDCEKDLGTNVKADGFCVTCVEYLCPTCIRYHKKHLPQHTLQDSDNMPQDFCLDKCTNHPKEISKFYCNTCQTTACPKCKTEKHGNCSEVCHIPTLVKTDKITNEIRQLCLSIDQTLEELAAKKDRVVSSITEVISNKKDAIAAIKMHETTLKRQVEDQNKHLLDDLGRKHTDEIHTHELKRAEIMATLDKEKAELLERHKNEKRGRIQLIQTQQDIIFENIDQSKQYIEKQCEQNNQSDVYKLQLILSRTDKAKAKVNEMKVSIDSKKKTGEKCELFVAMKNVKSDIEKIRTDMQKIYKDQEIQNYKFQVQEDTINLESTENEVRFGCLQDKSEVKRTLTYAGSMKRYRSRRNQGRSITGLCQVSDQLLVVDELNASIYVIDLKQDIHTSSIQLENQPFDVTCVDTYQVATTLPQAGKIQFLTISQTGKLSLAHKIDLRKKCYGIEYVKPNLLVTCQDPGCVQIVSKRGDPIQTLTGFDNPRYITVNKNSEIFYVEDIKNDTYDHVVKKASSDGKIISVSEIGGVSGLAVDNYGSVYTANSPSVIDSKIGSMLRFYISVVKHRLIQLSGNLERVQNIDIKKTKNSDNISCLFYCNKEKKIYAGTDDGEILIFTVT